MHDSYRTPGAGSITEIAPLIATDGKRIEFGWQRDRSNEVIARCHPVRVAHWLFRAIYVGSMMGFVLAGVAALVVLSRPDLLPEIAQPRYVAAATFVATILGNIWFSRQLALTMHARAIAALAPNELEWHARFLTTYPEVLSFDKRLAALRMYALNADDDREVDPELVRKYADDRASLDGRVRALYREQALRDFESAVGENDDGRFRETRDLSELVFVQRVRCEAADEEITALTRDDGARMRLAADPPDEAETDDEEGSAPPTLRSGRAQRNDA